MILKYDWMHNDPPSEFTPDPDAVLIGGGIMSATLGTLLNHLDPAMTIQVVEALPRVAMESSNAWNNAGTGHAALCELNYTPEKNDGTIDITKALKINGQFETSKHFWARLVEKQVIRDPSAFVRSIPHISFVRGEKNRDFLRRRHAAMGASPFFESMEYTDDPDTVAAWAPLLMEGRSGGGPLAATRVRGGTDVNYGKLTGLLMDHLFSLDPVKAALDTRVVNIVREKNGRWKLTLRGRDGSTRTLQTKYVFIGAGGGALPLLQRSGIPEGKGYGGFPVSGRFLLCRNEEVIERHAAKVYGKAVRGAPPVSVPHLDSRMVDGRKSLLFGPFAGFSPKFLKTGSRLDLFRSIKGDNLIPMLAAGIRNVPLTAYLINDCLKRHEDRCEALRAFFPAARSGDWTLLTAGQRVQIIRKDPGRGGRLQFGTEVVSASDGSLAAVLGASPGASTAVSIMLQVLERSFPQKMETDTWKERLAEMVPGYGKSLADDRELYMKLRAHADDLLNLGTS